MAELGHRRLSTQRGTSVLTQTDDALRRHGRARPGHLPTAAYALPFRWMPGTRPDMTIKQSLNYLNESEH